MTKALSLEDLIKIYLDGKNDQYPSYHRQLTKITCFFYEVNFYLFQAMVAQGDIKDRREFIRKFGAHPFSEFFIKAIDSGDWSIQKIKELPIPDLARYIKNYYHNNI